MCRQRWAVRYESLFFNHKLNQDILLTFLIQSGVIKEEDYVAFCAARKCSLRSTALDCILTESTKMSSDRIES